MERIPHPQANEALDTLWHDTKEQHIKLAILQEGTPMMNPETVTAWRAGDFNKAITLIYQDTKHEDFNKKTAYASEHGIEVIRMHLVEENSLSKDEPGYLDLLIEVFRRRNIPIGKEKVFLLPQRLCSDLPMPTTDITLFDTKAAVVTHYTDRGALEARDIYSRESDPNDEPFITQQVTLMENLRGRLNFAHHLAPVGRTDTTTWRNTIGANWLK